MSSYLETIHLRARCPKYRAPPLWLYSRYLRSNFNALMKNTIIKMKRSRVVQARKTPWTDHRWFSAHSFSSRFIRRILNLAITGLCPEIVSTKWRAIVQVLTSIRKAAGRMSPIPSRIAMRYPSQTKPTLRIRSTWETTTRNTRRRGRRNTTSSLYQTLAARWYRRIKDTRVTRANKLPNWTARAGVLSPN